MLDASAVSTRGAQAPAPTAPPGGGARAVAPDLRQTPIFTKKNTHFEERAIASDEKCEARAFEERALASDENASPWMQCFGKNPFENAWFW